MPETTATQSVVSTKDVGTEGKNVREREEITSLKKKFNTFRKYSFVFLVASGAILLLLFFLKPYTNSINAFFSKHPILGYAPELRTISFRLMLLFCASFIIWYLTHSLKVVQQFERAAIRRFGKWNRTRKAGLCLIIWPLIEQIRFEEVYARKIDIPKQMVNSFEGIPFPVDAVLYVGIDNLYAALYNVENFLDAIFVNAVTAIRNAASQLKLLEFNKNRDEIREAVKAALEDKASGNTSSEPTKPKPALAPKEPKDLPEDPAASKVRVFITNLLRKIRIRLKKSMGSLKKGLSFLNQEVPQEKGWGISVKTVEIQEIEIPKAIADQVAKVLEAEQKIKEADNLRKAKNIESEAVQYAFEKEGEGRKKLIEQQAGALNQPGGDRFMAIEVSKSIKPSDKIIYTDQALGGIGGTLARFVSGRNLDPRKDFVPGESGK